MFFRILVLLVSVLTAITSNAHADIRYSGAPCFDNALKRAQAGESLQTIIHRHIDIVTIANSAAWRKWQVRWNRLSPEQRNRAKSGVRSALQEIKDSTFSSVDLNSFVARSKLTKHGHRVWGEYKERNRGTSNFFDLMVNHQCKVLRISFNNVRLSQYVANRL